MIEVEKKFLLSPREEQVLLLGAEFVGTKDIVDRYYDDEFHRLTVSNKWLRRRGDAYELKVPLTRQSFTRTTTNQYHELETEESIRSELKIDFDGGTFESDILNAGFSVFCLCKTIRQSYQKDGFTIDIDTVTYEGSGFTYKIAEVEKLVESEDEVDIVESEIIDFAIRNELPVGKSIPGKVIAYLEIVKPDHYALLAANHVIN